VIYEIVIQQVDPMKRDEYIQAFGQALKQADYAGAHEIKLSRASKTRAG
jgi:hypothetical protein